MRHGLTHKLIAWKPLLRAKNCDWCLGCRKEKDTVPAQRVMQRSWGDRPASRSLYSVAWYEVQQKWFISDEQSEEGAVCSSLAFDDVFVVLWTETGWNSRRPTGKWWREIFQKKATGYWNFAGFFFSLKLTWFSGVPILVTMGMSIVTAAFPSFLLLLTSQASECCVILGLILNLP